VLLETGYSDGHEPAEMVKIVPLICTTGFVEPGDYDDTAEFWVRALLPMRTLIEKLFALHHVVSQHYAGANVSEIRFGRHYYDVYQLLRHTGTLQHLGNNDRYMDLVAEVERISATHFGGTTPRPVAGFASSPAFDRDGKFADWMREQYEASLSLVPEGAARPSFRAVLARVHQNAGRL